MNIRLSTDPTQYRIITYDFFPHAPGAPAQFFITDGRAVINSIRTILTCDANVANRYVFATFLIAGFLPYRFIDPAPITAGQSAIISIAPFIPFTHAPLAVPEISLPVPPDLELSVGDSIVIDCINRQAGDDFTPTYYQLKVWEAF